MNEYLYFRLHRAGYTVGFSRLDTKGDAQFMEMGSNKWTDDKIKYDDSIKLTGPAQDSWVR